MEQNAAAISQPLRKTALNSIHRQMGARMVDFAGWEMPVQYAGPIPEHLAVRCRAGIFDVSHMGELEVRGAHAEETLQRLTCNDISRMAVSQCQYTALTTPDGTIIDDLVVYRMAPNHFFLCVNASNMDEDFEWIRENAIGDTEVLHRSRDFTQLAIQGPRALEILRPLSDIRLAEMKYYWFARGKIAEADAIVSRTGYTGEDGFEVYFDPAHAEAVWTRVLESGKSYGLQPAGLAARNTLRLEAGLLLYGNDMDKTTTALEAGLGWICRLEKGDFIGREKLVKQRACGLKRILAGFEMAGRGVARDRYSVEIDGKNAGFVASGSPAPFLKKNIGLAYLPIERSAVGTEFEVVVRAKPVQARVVATPFYRRADLS